MAAEQPMAAGWYPDPDQANTVRYWDGQAWTEQRAPAKWSPNERMAPGVIAGIAIALAGIVAIIIGVFLPYADSKSFLRIVDNTVIHQGEGKVLLGLAIASILAVYGASRRDGLGGGFAVGLLGTICLAIAILMGAHMPELAPVNSGGLEALGLHSSDYTEKATPGIGIYVCGVGGLLLMLGGIVLLGTAEGAKAEPAGR